MTAAFPNSAAAGLPAQWPRLARAERMRWLRAAGAEWQRRWRSGAAATRILPVETMEQALAKNWNAVRDVLRPTEALIFLRSFLRAEGLAAVMVRDVAQAIAGCAARQRIHETAAWYRAALRARAAGRTWENMRLTGHWSGTPALAPDELLRALNAVETAPATRVIKRTAEVLVLRAQLAGRDVIIKRYTLATPWRRLKYCLRAARARRAWAAAVTLRRRSLPTPEPLGFLEIRRGCFPWRSYFITAFQEGAGSARKWLKHQYDRQPPELRAAIRVDVVAMLQNLYEHGIYHADTKTSNLLLLHPRAAARRQFFWVDLECMHFGCAPGRRRILRNLVQLNGSLGARVAEPERLAFLRDMSRHHPWVMQAGVIRHIRRWTARRLQRELRLCCGS